MTCPVPIRNSKRRGQPCGRSVVAFVAPGAGRCGYHATRRERIQAMAQRRAIRELRELRDAADVDRFAGDELAE